MPESGPWRGTGAKHRVRAGRRGHQGLVRGRRPGQYLVGAERIIPDIITATSAGAIAATVLAQARTHDEFAQRVQEIEDDILAMTRTEHVFGEQAWLRALEGTALGGAMQFALTEGTRPPPDRDRGEPGYGLGLPTGRRPRRRAAPSARARSAASAAAACSAWPRAPCIACPGHRRLAHQRQLGPQPRAAGRRHAPRRARAASAPSTRPGPPARAAAAPGRDRPAGRRAALRHRGRHHRRGGRRTPAPGDGRRPGRLGGRRPGLGQRAPGLPAPRTWPTTTTSTAACCRSFPVRAAAQLGATRIIAVVAMPAGDGPRRAQLLRRAAPANVGLRAHGHHRHGRPPTREPGHGPPRRAPR